VTGKLWLAAATILTAAHFASFDIKRQPIVTDVANYLYFAAQTAQGAVPHRDFFDNKMQLATFSGALFHRCGRACGVDPLLAIRAGTLIVAALAGLLLFELHRRLSGGRGACGFLGLLAYLGFSLLGLLPSIGNVPKLWMAACASLAALFAFNARWTLAGAAGALAAMDWQIGVLALIGVLAAAIAESNERRRAVLRVGIGALATVAPFALYYGSERAILPAFRQVVGASLARGAATLSTSSFAGRIDRLLESAAHGCPGQGWLLVAGSVGLAIFLFSLFRRRDLAIRRAATVLVVYHGGIVAYSFLDFQGYGDLFALLHSAAFFAGFAAAELFRRLPDLLRRGSEAGASVRTRRLLFAARAAVLLGFLLAVRPSVMRPEAALRTRTAGPDVTLDDQREVARDLVALLDGHKFVFDDASDQLFLAGKQNPVPFVFWNEAVHAYYRSSGEESSEETWERVVGPAQPELIVASTRSALRTRAARFEGTALKSGDGAYTVLVFRWR
jgi:hypothetical protein